MVEQETPRETWKRIFPGFYEEISRIIYNEDFQPEEVVIERVFEVLDSKIAAIVHFFKVEGH